MSSQNDDSDYSYDAEELLDNADETPDCPNIHSSSPTSAIPSPEEKKPSFLSAHKDSVQLIQEILLWKRPIAMILLVFLVETTLYVYNKLRPGFLATLALLYFLKVLYTSFASKAVNYLASILLKDKVPQGDIGDIDRIRDVDEVSRYFQRIQTIIHTVADIFRHLAQDDSTTGILINGGFYLLMFFLVANIDMFLVVAILVNLLLFLPGIFTNRKLRDILKVSK